MKFKDEIDGAVKTCRLVVTKWCVSLLYYNMEVVHYHKLCGNNLHITCNTTTGDLTLEFDNCCEWSQSASGKCKYSFSNSHNISTIYT